MTSAIPETSIDIAALFPGKMIRQHLLLKEVSQVFPKLPMIVAKDRSLDQGVTSRLSIIVAPLSRVGTRSGNEGALSLATIPEAAAVE